MSRLVDYCTNVSLGFFKEVVYFTKVVTKTSSTTMCPHILDIDISSPTNFDMQYKGCKWIGPLTQNKLLL